MKLEIYIPENLKEVKLSQWQKFANIEQPTDYDVLRCFYSLDTKGVFDLKATDVSRLVEHISKVLQHHPDELMPTFELNGVRYGFIPKLDDMTYGEYQDLVKYVNHPKTWHLAMAVMYRPITQSQFGKYLIEDYKGTADLAETMKDAPLEAFISAQVFFCDLMSDLLNYIPTYIKEESQPHTAENGEAIQVLLDSLTMTLQDLTKSLKKMYISV